MASPTRQNSLRWMVLLTVIVGTFLGRLDQTIVNLALPKIIDDFGVTVTTAGWIATAYILANAVFVPVWGKLGDTLGRKKIYMIGFIGFIIGSVFAGLAWNFDSMIAARIIQAIAGSADYPTAMAILAVTFKPGKERAQALGLWSASFAAATVFGPLIGGPLIDNLGWRSVFLINLPIGLIGLALALVYIKESTSEEKTKKFDWWGAVTLGIALTALVLVLDRGMDWGWLSLKSVAAYAVTLVFGYICVRIESTMPDPILDLKFFKNSIFVNTLINNFLVFMGMMGCVFLIPVFTQTFLGYTATQSGFLFMPMAVAMMFAAPLGGALTGRMQPRFVIAASTFVAAIGVFLFTSLDARSGPLAIIVPISVMAFGMGFGMAQRTNVIASAVPEHEVGIASSVLALARNIAGAFGIAVFGTLLNNSIKSKMVTASQMSSINYHGHDPTAYQQFVSLITLKAQIDSYRTVFLAAAAVLVVGAALSFLINVKKMRTDVSVHVE